MRKIAVATFSRSEYGIYYPIIKRIKQDRELELCLIVSGTHLSPKFGSTVEVIRQDGFDIAEEVDIKISSDSAPDIAQSFSWAVSGLSQSFSRHRPDIFLAQGDRYDMLAAVVATLPFNIPVAHIHGGEATFGAVDEMIRHAITKMSHIHFPATQEYRERIIQMGEEPWRVTVSGAPSLDNLNSLTLLSKNELSQKYGFDFNRPVILATLHPLTLQSANENRVMSVEFLTALEETNESVILTYPNADVHHQVLLDEIKRFAVRYPKVKVVESVGTKDYFSLMAAVSAMAGNSSSGLVEAPTFKLPVVNVGDRQRGRVRARNVIDAPNEREAIIQALKQALSVSFHQELQDVSNPYGDGQAAKRIVERLKNIPLDQRLIVKPFGDLRQGVLA